MEFFCEAKIRERMKTKIGKPSNMHVVGLDVDDEKNLTPTSCFEFLVGF